MSLNDPNLLRFFCRHLVGLGVTYNYLNSDDLQAPDKFNAYSGTLIQIHNTMCFLTAGHCLRDVENALKSNLIEVKNSALIDTFGQPSADTKPIPFDLKNARSFYIDDDELGLDFGVIILDPYYVRLLAANEIVALNKTTWIYQSNVKFDGFAMLGLPKEYASENVSESGEVFVSPTMFGVKRIDSLPVGSAETTHSRFIGRIDPSLPLNSIVGMSGGPIFGFRLSDHHYWVVALQSTWNRTTNIVHGCPIPTLAGLMTEWVDKN